MSSLALATLLAAVVLLASMVSVEAGLSVAILELAGGVIAGNALGLQSQPWLDFVAAFASIVLTFLAGAEVDVDQLRREWRPSVAIGLVSFAGPFVAATAAAHWLLGWSGPASAIAGIALSTTSLAVVYAVLVESGLNRSRLGKLLMSATFVTDLATAAALSTIFIRPNGRFLLFLAVSVGLILMLPRIAPPFFRRYGDRVIEPEIKLLFAAFFVLMYLGGISGGHAVLPAFVLGLAMARHSQRHPREQERLRVVAFAFLTPSSS
jgi:Kef-type K+ transport system membrane component KefB